MTLINSALLGRILLYDWRDARSWLALSCRPTIFFRVSAKQLCPFINSCILSQNTHLRDCEQMRDQNKAFLLYHRKCSACPLHVDNSFLHCIAAVFSYGTKLSLGGVLLEKLDMCL